MSTTPTPPSGVRGAVDLSSLAGPAGAPSGAAGAPVGDASSAGGGLPSGLLVEATDATVSQVLNRSLQVPAVLVLWSSAHEQTVGFAEQVARVAAEFDGRLFVVSADVATSPGILQAFQPVIMQAFGQLSIPVTFGLLQGQPVPLFPGIVPAAEIKPVLEQLLQVAVQNGVTGRVDLGPAEGGGDGAEDEMPPLPPLHQEAFDAIERGDLDGAIAAYEKALAADPKDHDAELGLAQTRLMQRTEGMDATQVRADAAANPADVAAQLAVADLDVAGGHVADAFTRLIDLVKTTSGDERDTVRTHLLDLFNVVGNHDERVRTARTALMNALF